MSTEATDITGADGLATLEARSPAETFGIPLAVLAELTHRCPLQCPYCSNPVELDRAGSELTTEEWKKVLSELAEIGVLQIHFSGGEPTARRDLVDLVQHATEVGLYSNLITSAVLLTKEKLAALADAGLCHVQISFQGNEPVIADRVAGLMDVVREEGATFFDHNRRVVFPAQKTQIQRQHGRKDQSTGDQRRADTQTLSDKTDGRPTHDLPDSVHLPAHRDDRRPNT